MQLLLITRIALHMKNGQWDCETDWLSQELARGCKHGLLSLVSLARGSSQVHTRVGILCDRLLNCFFLL